MIREIASFLSWVAVHKEALLCYATDDCECPWVEYSAEEVEELLLEFQAQKDTIAQAVTNA